MISGLGGLESKVETRETKNMSVKEHRVIMCYQGELSYSFCPLSPITFKPVVCCYQFLFKNASLILVSCEIKGSF
jgi:hypothetical protein